MCSAALWLDGQLESREALAGQRHSELLLPMVGELLAARALEPRDLDGVAYGAGPGSFTGLRIACGVAQGIAYGAGIPVIGIGTLLALAHAAQAQQIVCCLDARMGEIYHAAYRLLDDGSWQEVCEPSLCHPAAAPQLPAGAWMGCGSGFNVHRPVLAERYAGCLAGVIEGIAPHANEVAGLAALEFACGHAIAAADAMPLYVRNKVALRVDER